MKKNDLLEVVDVNEGRNNISLTNIFFIIADQVKVIIIVPFILCLFTSIYVLFIASPVYMSISKIMSSTGNSGSLNQALGIAAQFGFSLPTGSSETKWAYKDIIKSRTLAKKIINKKFNTSEFGEQKTLTQILTHGNEDPKYQLDTLEIMAIEKFLKMLNVHEDIKTSIFTIKTFAGEPELAYELNKILIEELDTHQKDYNKNKTSETRKFIEERIVETMSELKSAEDELENFLDRNRRIENSPTLQLAQQRLTREVTILTGVVTTLKQQLETTKIEEVRESNYIIIVDEPDLPLKKIKPQRKLAVIMSGFFGIFLGLIIAVVRFNYKNQSKKQKDKFQSSRKLLSKNLLEVLSLKKYFSN